MTFWYMLFQMITHSALRALLLSRKFLCRLAIPVSGHLPLLHGGSILLLFYCYFILFVSLVEEKRGWATLDVDWLIDGFINRYSTNVTVCMNKINKIRKRKKTFFGHKVLALCLCWDVTVWLYLLNVLYVLYWGGKDCTTNILQKKSQAKMDLVRSPPTYYPLFIKQSKDDRPPCLKSTNERNMYVSLFNNFISNN